MKQEVAAHNLNIYKSSNSKSTKRLLNTEENPLPIQ